MDGALRFCIYYRKRNDLTVRDTYPLPATDERIECWVQHTGFTTLDANSGFWKIEIDDGERDKRTFTSHHGIYRSVRMAFGLNNATWTFQRVVYFILVSVKCQYALVYLEDVIICSRTAVVNLMHVQLVLRLLPEAGVSLKRSKCFFFTYTVD